MEQLYRAMLEVLDDPKQLRVIVYTNIPTLESIGEENLYYMIDHSEDCGETVADHWHVINSDGAGCKFGTNEEVINFFEAIAKMGVELSIHTETY